MEYEGKLYGKVGKSYFPLIQTTEDFDTLQSEKAELVEMLTRFNRINNAAKEHISKELLGELEQLLTKING